MSKIETSKILAVSIYPGIKFNLSKISSSIITLLSAYFIISVRSKLLSFEIKRSFVFFWELLSFVVVLKSWQNELRDLSFKYVPCGIFLTSKPYASTQIHAGNSLTVEIWTYSDDSTYPKTLISFFRFKRER